MDGGKVKGFLFEHAFGYIKKHWGETGVETLRTTAKASYNSDQWYPLEEFCELLSNIVVLFNRDDIISKLGYESIVMDIRYKSLFRKKNPQEVLMGTENQDREFQCGEFDFITFGTNIIGITLNTCLEDEDSSKLWCEYYEGRVKGVLDLMGKEGKIDTEFIEGEKNGGVYRVRWA